MKDTGGDLIWYDLQPIIGTVMKDAILEILWNDRPPREEERVSGFIQALVNIEIYRHGLRYLPPEEWPRN